MYTRTILIVLWCSIFFIGGGACFTTLDESRRSPEPNAQGTSAAHSLDTACTSNTGTATQMKGTANVDKYSVTKIQIYAEDNWYRTRSEPEKSWIGTLQENKSLQGPNTRPSLKYILISQEGRFPIYSANIEQKLAPFVGCKLSLSGKVVDLTNEGFGQELWIASFEIVE